METVINDREFRKFQQFILKTVGIDLAPTKKAMVTARLAKRLRHYQLESYGAYFDLVMMGQYPEEQQVLIDLLTTNETYFFREKAHFDFLQQKILPSWRRSQTFRVWSAASSTGEEGCSRW